MTGTIACAVVMTIGAPTTSQGWLPTEPGHVVVTYQIWNCTIYSLNHHHGRSLYFAGRLSDHHHHHVSAGQMRLCTVHQQHRMAGSPTPWRSWWDSSTPAGHSPPSLTVPVILPKEIRHPERRHSAGKSWAVGTVCIGFVNFLAAVQRGHDVLASPTPTLVPMVEIFSIKPSIKPAPPGWRCPSF